ncbi:MAG: hypothetical protein DRI90_16565 [Deltaproteobacteria bacterium]|nr:MAG: hypothetical protein DRI90_16565 [Deltaproteobacteria bacterium]
MQSSTEIGIDELDEGLRGLRLSTPVQQQAMDRSLAQHGQLTAVLANREGKRLELVDGFKRLHAARTLRWATVQVHVLTLEPAEAKLHMVHSNAGNTLSDIEQAWLIRSLYRDDGLTQPRIAQLFRRHKSWVNRRLLLAEGLSDEVQADLRLGLVTATAARQLARLPRGNQAKLAELVARRGLTSRQTDKLVDDWLAAPDERQRQRVTETAGKLGGGGGLASRRMVARSACEWMVEDIDQMMRRAGRLQARLLDRPLASHGAGAAELIAEQLCRLQSVLAALGPTIQQALGASGQVLLGRAMAPQHGQESHRNAPHTVA